uniref:small monomeric GTPase n=2 Tax=Culicoides sonorensis TaxID=179676 RepID=A0A336MVC8_CULSO
MMNSTSPKSSLAKLGLHSNKQKTFRVMVLGQSGVGKTAMVVRFITKRFIGDYDPNLEKIYTHNTVIDNDVVLFEILDATGHMNEADNINLETNIRWAEAFILTYSVTDKCSFDECNRLKFLINYNKRRRRLGSNHKEGFIDVPVILVGNKIDQFNDRMVSTEEGQKRSKEIACACFHEISVRENIEQVTSVFRDAYRFHRVLHKFPKLKRSSSDVHDLHNEVELILSPDSVHSYCDCDFKSQNRNNIYFLDGQSYVEENHDDDKESENNDRQLCCTNSHSKSNGDPFRNRASTDGNLSRRPRKWKYPSFSGPLISPPARIERRMSISMRGSNTNASY